MVELNLQDFTTAAPIPAPGFRKPLGTCLLETEVIQAAAGQEHVGAGVLGRDPQDRFALPDDLAWTVVHGRPLCSVVQAERVMWFSWLRLQVGA